jgi:hypothetical protein
VEGIYAYADGGESRQARLYFQDGVLRHVYGFTGEQGTGAPREIVPQAGDSFTLLDEWMDLDANGNVIETVYQEGATLVFREQTFTWEALDAAPGEYIVGFIVIDLDGNQYPVYSQVSVR